jgi:hypothetical protein
MKDEPAKRRVNVEMDNTIHKQLRHEALAANVPMVVILEDVLTKHFNQVKDNDRK